MYVGAVSFLGRWAVSYWQTLSQSSFSHAENGFLTLNGYLPLPNHADVYACNGDVNGCMLKTKFLPFLKLCRNTLRRTDWVAGNNGTGPRWVQPLPEPVQQQMTPCQLASNPTVQLIPQIPLPPIACGTSLNNNFAEGMLAGSVGSSSVGSVTPITSKDLLLQRAREACNWSVSSKHAICETSQSFFP
jgi:hypothetical protein